MKDKIKLFAAFVACLFQLFNVKAEKSADLFEASHSRKNETIRRDKPDIRFGVVSDGVHPNDWGMVSLAKAYGNAVQKALGLPGKTQTN